MGDLVPAIPVFRWGNRLKEVKQFLWGHMAGGGRAWFISWSVWLQSSCFPHATIWFAKKERNTGMISWRFALKAPDLGRWKKEMNVYFKNLPMFTNFFGYRSSLHLRPALCDHCSSQLNIYPVNISVKSNQQRETTQSLEQGKFIIKNY